MKKLTLVALALVVALGATVAAAANKPVAFTGKYTGTATTKTTDSAATIAANGTGTGTLIGAGKITGNGTADTTQRPCLPFTGTGTITGKTGSIVFRVNPTSSACGDDAGQLFSFTGKATVLKATGKLLRAKGTLKLTGTYDRSSGAFSAKFTGLLTK